MLPDFKQNNDKDKGKVHPRTGRDGRDGGVEV